MPQQYKPGDEVPRSGIYRVTHDPEHGEPHEVTCIGGRRFRECKFCKNARFELLHAARYIKGHKYFSER